MNELSDEDLIVRSKAGDALAFKALVERNESKVAGVVKSMLGDSPEASDVGQEAFVRFYQAMNNYKGEAKVSTYLIRIAINLSLNELKRRKRQKFLFTRVEEAGDVKVPAENADAKEWVAYEINRLDPDFRSVVTLRLIEGYSTVETAEILGIPLGTVLSRLARAQKKLKMGLSKYLKS